MPQLADIKTAVSEAVTNCIVHAYPDHIGPVVMSIAVYPGREVHITVADKGVSASRISRRPWSLSLPPETRKSAPVLGFCGDAELYG